jgi:hypothetical protein
MTRDEVKEWIESQERWPTADSYELDTLNPRPQLASRERSLKEIVPPWFWEGEPGASLLSIGTGKGYFERKYWRNFERVYSIDPSTETHRGLAYFPIPNVSLVGSSLFDVFWRDRNEPTPKYAWLGACIHYVFREFHGWEFMRKLAMIVSDTLVIDAGVFDSDTPQGKFLLDMWTSAEPHGKEPFEKYRRSQFSYPRFLEAISGLWNVAFEAPTAWIADGRRNVILKRILPPVKQKSEIGLMKPISKAHNLPSSVYKVDDGYYKESKKITSLLTYDVVSKIMGWKEMVRYSVYDGEAFSGFVVKDYGDHWPDPDDPAISERMHHAVLSWSLQLGLLPADVARENIRIHDGRAVWIDINLIGLRELDARTALWLISNTYKQYRQAPEYVNQAMFLP